MYWPVGSIQRLRDEHLGDGETILAFQFSRRSNLFVTLGECSLTLWIPEVSSFPADRFQADATQPTCRIARVERTRESRGPYGDNQHVEWSSDGHSVFVSVSIVA